MALCRRQARAIACAREAGGADADLVFVGMDDRDSMKNGRGREAPADGTMNGVPERISPGRRSSA